MPSVPSSLIRSTSKKEITAEEYCSLNHYLKEYQYADVREHVKSLMQNDEKITYADLAVVLIYTEGKNAWIDQQTTNEGAQLAKEELVQAREELVTDLPEVNALSNVDNRKDVNKQMEIVSRRDWRKVIVEPTRDALDD